MEYKWLCDKTLNFTHPPTTLVAGSVTEFHGLEHLNINLSIHYCAYIISDGPYIFFNIFDIMNFLKGTYFEEKEINIEDYIARCTNEISVLNVNDFIADMQAALEDYLNEEYFVGEVYIPSKLYSKIVKQEDENIRKFLQSTLKLKDKTDWTAATYVAFPGMIKILTEFYKTFDDTCDVFMYMSYFLEDILKANKFIENKIYGNYEHRFIIQTIIDYMDKEHYENSISEGC